MRMGCVRGVWKYWRWEFIINGFCFHVKALLFPVYKHNPAGGFAFYKIVVALSSNSCHEGSPVLRFKMGSCAGSNVLPVPRAALQTPPVLQECAQQCRAWLLQTVVGTGCKTCSELARLLLNRYRACWGVGLSLRCVLHTTTALWVSCL